MTGRCRNDGAIAYYAVWTTGGVSLEVVQYAALNASYETGQLMNERGFSTLPDPDDCHARKQAQVFFPGLGVMSSHALLFKTLYLKMQGIHWR
jgi:hypothetical protein